MRRYWIDAAGLGEPEHTAEAVAAGEDRHEPVLVGGAVHDLHAVVAAEATGALDLDVVLVRPDEGDGHERLGGVAGEERAGRVGALLGGIGPVLDPHELVVERRVGPAAHVAGRDDAGARRSALSQTTPLSTVSPEPSSQSVAGAAPTATSTTSHCDRGAVGQSATRLDAVGAEDGFDADAEAEVDAVGAMQAGEHRADHGSDAADHRLGQRLEHGDLAAVTACGRRDLGADEPGPDDAEAGAVGDERPRSRRSPRSCAR